MAVEIRGREYNSAVLIDWAGYIVLHFHSPDVVASLAKDGGCKACADGIPFCTRFRRVVTDEKHVQLYADDVLFREYDL